MRPIGPQHRDVKPPEVVPVKLTYHRERKPGVVVDGAVVHSMAEYIQDGEAKVYAPDWLQKMGLSVHAFITPDGKVLQGPGMDRVTFHAGKSKFLDREWLNNTFLGCEFLVAGTHDYGSFLKAIRDGSPYTEAQYDAGGWLYATWMAAFPGMTKARVVAHSAVSGPDVRPKDPKEDPGPGFSWGAFWDRVDVWTTRLNGGKPR